MEQPRSTQRHEPLVRDDEQALTDDIVGLASRFGRYGYRRITALLRRAGWEVNHKRVERIWQQEGLKVPARQPRRGHLWLNDGSSGLDRSGEISCGPTTWSRSGPAMDPRCGC